MPFHVSTIKSITIDQDKVMYFKINFYTPGAALPKDAPKNIGPLVAKYEGVPFIKDLMFRSLDKKNMEQVYRIYLGNQTLPRT